LKVGNLIAALALCAAPFPSPASELGVNYNGVPRTYSRLEVALRQTQPELGPHTDPWILNALYCNQTCEPNGSRRPEPNFWMDSFRSRQTDRK